MLDSLPPLRCLLQKTILFKIYLWGSLNCLLIRFKLSFVWFDLVFDLYVRFKFLWFHPSLGQSYFRPIFIFDQVNDVYFLIFRVLLKLISLNMLLSNGLDARLVLLRLFIVSFRSMTRRDRVTSICFCHMLPIRTAAFKSSLWSWLLLRAHTFQTNESSILASIEVSLCLFYRLQIVFSILGLFRYTIRVNPMWLLWKALSHLTLV